MQAIAVFGVQITSAANKLNDVFFVAMNGTSLCHCDSVVGNAMDRDWYFYKTTVL